jgi:glucokinase
MIKIKKRIITFDIGGTNISGGVIEFNKKGYVFLDYFKQKNSRNDKIIRKLLLEKSQEYRREFKTRKIAISTSKIVDNKKKSVSPAKSVYGKDRFSFEFLRKARFSVEIENDGVCFARGEYLFGKGEVAGLLTLSLGTGIGGGFISQEREVFRGSNNSAMEVSFVKMNRDGKWLSWEDIASGSGIEKTFFSKTKKKKTAEEIFSLQEVGNKLAKESIEDAQEFLGMGVANLINIFDPEKVIFGGSLSQRKDFMKKIIDVSKENVFNKKGRYKFVISSLGRKANQLGAASLYF